jgi:hypothetical protein
VVFISKTYVRDGYNIIPIRGKKMRNKYKGCKHKKIKADNLNQAVRKMVEKDRLKAKGRRGRHI